MSRTSKSDRDAFWRKLIAEQHSSRRTVAQLCEQAGVSTAAFYAWRQRLKTPGHSSSSLVPVRIIENRDDEDDAMAARGADGRGAVEYRDRGEMIVELGEAALAASAARVRIPPSCDEESIRRVLRAALAVLRERSASC